jgi:hypothetical protein
LSVRRRPSRVVLPALLLLALVLVACGGGNQPSSVSWRNVELQLPDGWYVFEEEADRLSISNQDIGFPEPGEDARERPEGDIVAMFFTYEPNTLPADWREYVVEQGATLESDDQILLDGDVPATRLVFSYVTNGIPTREMVAVIPSRAIVVLAQPVPGPGDTDAPEIFLDHIETFIEVLEQADFGAPLLD